MVKFEFPKNPSPLRIFLSYSSSNKEIAGQIKHFLEEKYFFEVFLAHEDIMPTREWQEEIIKNLKICDFLVGIITNEFNESEWTDQEIGYAMGREIPVLTLNFGAVPHGFVARFQALPAKQNEDGWNISKLCFEIFKLLKMNQKTKEKVIDGFIFKFGESSSFKEAEENISRLTDFFDDFTKEQINNIVKHSISNSQIYNCFACKRMLRDFVKKYETQIDIDILSEFKSKYIKEPDAIFDK